MKKQKKDKRRQSTQQLMGIQKITDYCISTDAGDLVFYIIKPTNISVLPAGAVSAKIRALQNTLSAQAGSENASETEEPDEPDTDAEEE